VGGIALKLVQQPESGMCEVRVLPPFLPPSLLPSLRLAFVSSFLAFLTSIYSQSPFPSSFSFLPPFLLPLFSHRTLSSLPPFLPPSLPSL